MIANAGLGAVLLLATALRLWRLDQNGFDNEYYAAAVRSMAASAHNFLYNSFDPAGFVSVDKPPVALWIQVGSAKLLGFGWLSVLLPQVIEGVASVWLAHHLVRRAFGAPAGLLAALFLALTPVSVAVDRSGNTESCLALVLLLAAWALLRAAETGGRRYLLLAMALIGLGFNVKMLAAWVVLPTFALVYFLGAPLARRRRIADLALSGVVLVAVSAPWVLAYDLTPADRRPFAGSSAHNSMVELAVGHNAIGRFVRLTGAPRSARADAPPAGEVARPASADGADSAPRLSGAARLFVRAPVGPLRLADGLLAAQVEWLFPLALLGLVAGALDGRLRRPIGPAHLAVVLWAGWAITYAAVYSYAGGIFHFYYLSTMAPPLAALAGIGVVWLWQSHANAGARALLLPAALLLTAAWQIYVEAQSLGWRAGRPPALMAVLFPAGDWRAGLHIALVAGAVVAAGWTLALALLRARRHVTRAFALPALAVGVIALLALPAAWSLSAVLVKGVAVLPSADLVRLAPGALASESRARAQAAAANTAALIDFLARQRQGERYLLATSSTRAAAPIILETGEPVMAMGGFHGLDQILTPADLARLVDARHVRFVMLGDLSPISERMGGDAALAPLSDWVRAHGSAVDPSLWRPDTRRRGRTADWQLYDLLPERRPSAAASR